MLYVFCVVWIGTIVAAVGEMSTGCVEVCRCVSGAGEYFPADLPQRW